MSQENVKALPAIGFVEATKKGFKNLFNFSGKAGRGEFWWCCLSWLIALPVASVCASIISGIVLVIISLFSNIVGGTTAIILLLIPPAFVVLLFLIILLALVHRRLRDTGTNIHWGTATICLTPFALIGLFLLVVWIKVLFEADWGGEREPFSWNEFMEDLKRDWFFLTGCIVSILSFFVYIPVFIKTFKALNLKDRRFLI